MVVCQPVPASVMSPIMLQNPKWMFAENQDGAFQGPNESGIVNFAGDRATAIIREAIQNSLDARQGERPVSVSFERRMLDKSILATEDLLQHIEWSIESPFNDDENRPDFSYAKSLLGGGVEEITCLCITDSNTTGAIDKEDDNISPWKALTKGSGFPRKTSNKATGSYGIGKFASFASTYLRTVLYSTAFKSNGGLKHRFQGKTILVSYKDKVLPFKDDLISLPDANRERLSIEIKTREPVQDKSFDLRFIK